MISIYLNINYYIQDDQAFKGLFHHELFHHLNSHTDFKSRPSINNDDRIYEIWLKDTRDFAGEQLVLYGNARFLEEEISEDKLYNTVLPLLKTNGISTHPVTILNAFIDNYAANPCMTIDSLTEKLDLLIQANKQDHEHSPY